MPLFNLKCPNGHQKSLLTVGQSWDKVPDEKKMCPVCNEIMTRNGTGPTSNVKEKLDNGLMPKAIERYSNAEELYQNRNKNADPKAGGRNFS